MTSDKLDLLRGYLHCYGGSPVVLIDGCQPEGRRIVHGAIFAPEGHRGNR